MIVTGRGLSTIHHDTFIPSFIWQRIILQKLAGQPSVRTGALWIESKGVTVKVRFCLGQFPRNYRSVSLKHNAVCEIQQRRKAGPVVLDGFAQEPKAVAGRNAVGKLRVCAHLVRQHGDSVEGPGAFRIQLPRVAENSAATHASSQSKWIA